MTQPVEVEARVRLRSIVSRTTELTPLRAVATKAIQLAEDERTATMDLAAVLSSDQALTAKLLRLSNSAYYGYSRRIANVREAVVLLGMRTVRSVAITSGIIDSLEVPPVGGFDQDLFWAHGVCVGLVAETIARATKVARPEDAFTAGVLHDVGKLAMVITEPALFAETLDLVANEGMTFNEAELAVYRVSHKHVGARLAQQWKFPPALVEAIEEHHPPRMKPTVESLADVVAAANLACNRAGLACGWDWTADLSRQRKEALPPEVDRAIDRVYGGMNTIQEKGRAFLLHVTSRPPRWYASAEAPAMAADGGEDEQVA